MIAQKVSTLWTGFAISWDRLGGDVPTLPDSNSDITPIDAVPTRIMNLNSLGQACLNCVLRKRRTSTPNLTTSLTEWQDFLHLYRLQSSSKLSPISSSVAIRPCQSQAGPPCPGQGRVVIAEHRYCDRTKLDLIAPPQEEKPGGTLRTPYQAR